MERRPIVIEVCRRKRTSNGYTKIPENLQQFCCRPCHEIAMAPPPQVKPMASPAPACANQSGKRFEARLSVNGRRTPGLIQSANPKGKIGPVRTRDLQSFIGDVEGEDLFFFSPQCIHGSDPFSFRYDRAARIALFPQPTDVLSYSELSARHPQAN
jgi:hypothetical protein